VFTFEQTWVALERENRRLGRHLQAGPYGPISSRPLYHGEHGVRTLKELGAQLSNLTQDVSRVMSWIKAVYRGWWISCAGTTVYAPAHRAELVVEN
jgi:hypothetical protein